MNRRNTIIISIVVAVVVIGLGVLTWAFTTGKLKFFAAVPSGAASVTFANPVYVNNTISTDIVVNTGGKDISAVDIRFNINPIAKLSKFKIIPVYQGTTIPQIIKNCGQECVTGAIIYQPNTFYDLPPDGNILYAASRTISADSNLKVATLVLETTGASASDSVTFAFYDSLPL
jgi:hypothetical protein